MNILKNLFCWPWREYVRTDNPFIVFIIWIISFLITAYPVYIHLQLNIVGFSIINLCISIIPTILYAPIADYLCGYDLDVSYNAEERTNE